MINVLNVAEKPSVAKNISHLLSNNNCSVNNTISKYNHLYNFKYALNEKSLNMNFTSVIGHIMELAFPLEYKNWSLIDPIELFNAPINKNVHKDKELISKLLENEAKRNTWLILWLDCDREGENIAYEVINICIKSNPRLKIYRAHFSALIANDLHHAMNNLTPPNFLLSEAVDCRQEIDLRLGAIFTRRQSLQLQSQFSDIKGVVSYGPCQFPTLGFVVKRQLQREQFKSEIFWSLNAKYITPLNETVNFLWDRGSLFDREVVLILLELCCRCDPGSMEFNNRDAPIAKVIHVEEKHVTHWKPLPLNTIEYQKAASQKLHMTSEHAMKIAENLYTQGIISYPRTETDMFKEGTDLIGLIREQISNDIWGGYAQRLIDGEYSRPRAGKGDDKAHPPIHPLKSVSNLEGDDKKVYDYIVRRFLAACSADATGNSTKVNILVSTEMFHVNGLIISARNYLDIYPFDTWASKSIPPFKVNDYFTLNNVEMSEGNTRPPELLKEYELISLMDKYGIGTDATVAQHITTIQDREYAVKEGAYFRATNLGVALVQSYSAMQIDLYKPRLRAEMERDITSISNGQKTKAEVLELHLTKMKEVYRTFVSKNNVMLNAMANYYDRIGSGNREILKRNLSKCANLMNLEKSQAVTFLNCPTCNDTYNLPRNSDFDAVINHICPYCNFQALNVYRDSNRTSKYNICPYCYNNPPQIPDLENAANSTSNRIFACFSCDNSNCILATKSPNKPVMPCSCNKNMFLLKSKSNPNQSTSYYLSCKSYPNCKCTASIPSCTEISVTSQTCSNCSYPAGDNSGQFYLVKITFKPNSMPMHVPLQITACLNCDEDLSAVVVRRGGDGPPAISRDNPQSIPPSRYSRNDSISYEIAVPSIPRFNNSYGSSEIPPPRDNFNDRSTNADIRCYKCEKVGHFASQCPQLPSSKNFEPSSRGSNSWPNRSDNPLNENGGQICYKCNQPGHFANNCSNPHNSAPKSYPSNNNTYSNGGGQVCYKCNQPGHFANNCSNQSNYVPKSYPSNNNNSSAGLVCYKCNKPGHFANLCDGGTTTSSNNSSKYSKKSNNYEDDSKKKKYKKPKNN